jgi:hypothetical protein
MWPLEDLEVLETGKVGDNKYVLVKVKFFLLGTRFYMQVNRGSLRHYCWSRTQDRAFRFMRNMTMAS